MIEVEIRSFISKEQYSSLLEFFHKGSEYLGEDEQETFYFDSPVDLRIQRNTKGAKIWLKKGKIHETQREEIEVLCKKENFDE